MASSTRAGVARYRGEIQRVIDDLIDAFAANGTVDCPGASLSRLEQQMALRTLLDRMANLRFGSGNDFKHAPGFVLRSLNRLHLEFDPVPTAKR